MAGAVPSAIRRSKLSVARRSTLGSWFWFPVGPRADLGSLLSLPFQDAAFSRIRAAYPCTPKRQRTTRVSGTGRHAHRSRHDGLRAGTVVTDGPVWYKDAGTDRMPCPARIFHHPAAAADPGSA